MPSRKTQASVELIVVLAAALTIFLVILGINNRVSTGVQGQLRSAEAGAALDSITGAAQRVYQQGVGAKTRSYVTFPDGISHINISNRTVVMEYYAGTGTRHAYRNLDFTVSGNLPTGDGAYWVCTESMIGRVSITDCSNQTSAQQCGNNIKDATEECDGFSLTPYTSECSTHPSYTGGTLACHSNCTYDYSSCTNATEDTTPPATLTALANQSAGTDWIYWTWTNPADADYDHAEIWINDTHVANVSAPADTYNATGLSESTAYQVQTRTADSSGNINTSWVNYTAATRAEEAIQNITVFHDGFETWGAHDCDHNGLWDLCSEGDGKIRRDNNQYNGSRSIDFSEHDADTDHLIKCLDLSGYTNAWVSFWWSKSRLDSGEYGRVDVNSTTQPYNQIFDSGTGTSAYAEEVIDISSYISSSTCIKIHALANKNNDIFYIDAFTITTQS